MLGGTEYVAEACEEKLRELGHEVTLHLQPNFAEIPQEDQIWLICTSTHGAGDYPDNIQGFVYDLERASTDLINIPFFVIGLGDTNYDTFCFAAKNIEKLLLSKGCKNIIELKTFDMASDIDPEIESQTWLDQNKDHLS